MTVTVAPWVCWARSDRASELLVLDERRGVYFALHGAERQLFNELTSGRSDLPASDETPRVP